MKKGVFLKMFTQSWTFGSVWPSREMWLCQNIMFLGLCEKNKPKTNHCIVFCMTSEPELQEIRHCPSLGRPSRTACAFFLCRVTYPHKQTRKQSTKQFLKYSVSGEKKNLKQFKINVFADSVTEFYLWEGLLKCSVPKLSIRADFSWFPSFLRYYTHFPFSKDDQILPTF